MSDCLIHSHSHDVCFCPKASTITAAHDASRTGAPGRSTSVGYARMTPTRLSLEVYRNIVSEIGNHSDLATLCKVCKGFQKFAERALYNTLYMRTLKQTALLCRTLATNKRIALLVDALTIYAAEETEVTETTEEDSEDNGHVEPHSELPEDYWSNIGRALEQTSNIHYLNILITNANAAWIFDKCTFQLKSLHCDLDWDDHLLEFLNRQSKLEDLCLMDFGDAHDPTSDENQEASGSITPHRTLIPSAFPGLTRLECVFSEPAMAIVPSRPITHLKTCFSHTELEEKREEMTLLMSKIRQSTRPLRSLDIGDSAYTESFSMELLTSVVNAKTTSSELRYLATLVLPISGKERLLFYGLLMRLPRIQCVEVEVSHWVPPPNTPPAFRALANEMRLYSPSVKQVIFVNDDNRTVVTTVDGVVRLDTNVNWELIWRDI